MFSKYIEKLINHENIDITSLSNEQLSNFAEYCFNIITQFQNMTPDVFMNQFYTIIEKIMIEQENAKDEQEEKNEINFYKSYYKYLDDMEQEYVSQIDGIRKMKDDIAPIKVKMLQELPQPEQRSQEWYDMRYNMITASDVGTIIGYNKYQRPKDVILKKCGHGKFKGNIYTLHGQKFEPVATSLYESRYNATVIEFGLIQHPKISFIGASPDGITDEGIMVEIKCPYTRAINGDIMYEKTLSYYAQIQIQLEVCDLNICDFWECQFDIRGYNTFVDYLDDKYIPENVEKLNILPEKNYPLNYIKVPDDRRSSNGLEKGIIVKIRKEDQEQDEYLYPPFDVSTQEQLQWISQYNENDYTIFEPIYWKIKKTSCCRVYRDRQWFAQHKPTLEKFWQNVLKYRKIGCDDLLGKPKKVLDLTSFSMVKKSSKPPPKKPKIEKNNDKFLFTNISDDDDD